MHAEVGTICNSHLSRMGVYVSNVNTSVVFTTIKKLGCSLDEVLEASLVDQTLKSFDEYG